MKKKNQKKPSTRIQSSKDEGRGATIYSVQFWIVLSAILLFSVAIKLPSLNFPHKEPDEQVYLTLAEQLHASHAYSLQETPIIYELSPGIYDRPLFFHPPLFPLSLVPFVSWKVPALGVVVSWLGHLLCILAVALIGRRLVVTLPEEGKEPSLPCWLPVIGVALDPFLLFISRRLWIDSLLSGLCAISIAVFFVARYSRRRNLWLIVGGLLFGLATLCKMTAFVATPLILYLVLTSQKSIRPPVKDLTLACIPAILLASPWYLTFYRTYGVFVPAWVKPDGWTLDHYPFIRTTIERGPGYYLARLVEITPVIILAIGPFLFWRRLWTNAVFLVGPIWFLLYFAFLSYLGLNGTGFQMRYIAPLQPSIYVMLYAALSGTGPTRNIFAVCTILLLFFAAITGAIYLFSWHFDEIDNFWELAHVFRGA